MKTLALESVVKYGTVIHKVEIIRKKLRVKEKYVAGSLNRGKKECAPTSLVHSHVNILYIQEVFWFGNNLSFSRARDEKVSVIHQ